MDESDYRRHFRYMTRSVLHPAGMSPYNYQINVARKLSDGRNLIVRAPTGAGKTWAVLAPFLYDGWKGRPSRLIYALPLRTLANGVYQEACKAAKNLGQNPDSVTDHHDRERLAPFVTLQTGEQPDDPFFSRGKIIITTYDQVLSGVLGNPYGLSPKLRNINAAALAGSIVVFDEFHLMPPAMAFITAAATLNLFRELAQSVWMTATATSSLRMVLGSALDTEEVPSDDGEFDKMCCSLESVTTVSRTLKLHRNPMSIDAIVAEHGGRSIVLLNTVERAQDTFRALKSTLSERKRKTEPILLHSRFFKLDREQKEERLRALFGAGSNADAILVATQVIEAGIDISASNLHTELCPMSSLVQRAGRCARFRGEVGTVHVYGLPDDARNWLPYGDLNEPDPALDRTQRVLDSIAEASITPKVVADWVEEVHAQDDAATLGASDLAGAASAWRRHRTKCTERIRQSLPARDVTVSDLIRGDDDDNLRIVIADVPPLNPGIRDGLKISRGHLIARFEKVSSAIWSWSFDGEESGWKRLSNPAELRSTYAACLGRSVAHYDSAVGLIVGEPGFLESQERTLPPRPGHYSLTEEKWVDHANKVAAAAELRLQTDYPPDGMVARAWAQLGGYETLREAIRVIALLHDLGKLQVKWYRWAEAAMREYKHGYVIQAPLAHTTFDPDNPDDLERERSLRRQGILRPGHAQASALYAWPIIDNLLPSTPKNTRRALGAACLASILSHHGGWLPTLDRETVDSMIAEWEEALEAVLNLTDLSKVPTANLQTDKFGKLGRRLNHAIGADAFPKYWPIVSMLMRILRLSDQRATAETHAHE